MGIGEYAEDAQKRQPAGDFQETASNYSTFENGSTLLPMHARQILRCPDTQTAYIDPSILHFGNYNNSLRCLQEASQISITTGRSPGEELVRNGTISRTEYVSITAHYRGVEFSPDGPRPDLLTEESLHKGSSQNQSNPTQAGGEFFSIAKEGRGRLLEPALFVATEPDAYDAINQLIEYTPPGNSKIVLTTSKKLRAAQFIANQGIHLHNAIHGLAEKFPNRSASNVITRWQVVAAIVLTVTMIFLMAYMPSAFMLIIHLIATLFYISLTLMRAAMIIVGSRVRNNRPGMFSPTPANDRELPVYTAMVALYQEAGQIDELANSLANIDWPCDRMQIMLICEADDPATIAKCKQFDRDERFQTIICPVSQPRTKSKALNFALPLARGEFVVLYDAEDRPHPQQLREAYHKFFGNNDFACLQAPLFVHNDRQSWFTRMFAIEYTTLFGLILPVLERWQSPIPLGGTSNHFRASVLREIGAWDPYNVTEDADLGIRLARNGYRCGTITLPTMEEAPPFLSVWFKQRTRWLKGWIQTLLVHTRNPMSLGRQLGQRNLLFFHLVITAIVVSALIHPIFIASSIYYGIKLANGTNMDNLDLVLLGIDAFNIVDAYSTYAAVAILALDVRQKKHLAGSIIWIPVYWILISLAAWKALAQLFYNPFYWEKTEHGLTKS